MAELSEQEKEILRESEEEDVDEHSLDDALNVFDEITDNIITDNIILDELMKQQDLVQPSIDLVNDEKENEQQELKEVDHNVDIDESANQMIHNAILEVQAKQEYTHDDKKDVDIDESGNEIAKPNSMEKSPVPSNDKLTMVYSKNEENSPSIEGLSHSPSIASMESVVYSNKDKSAAMETPSHSASTPSSVTWILRFVIDGLTFGIALINLKFSIDLYRAKSPQNQKKYNHYLVILSLIFCGIYVAAGLLLNNKNIIALFPEKTGNFAQFPAVVAIILVILMPFMKFKLNKTWLTGWIIFCAITVVWMCVVIAKQIFGP